MHIKDVEQRTGLSRANIRYYEQEGLVHPARRKNGYRDYSPDDLEALLRIRLLRRLDVPIEEIRAMQAGKLSLSEALSRVMEERRIYCCQGADQPLPVTDGNDRYTAAVAAPILCEGDVLGLVLFLSAEGQIPGEGEYKLAQTVSAFLGKHMEA
jgi:DNA-binding transcriptional MerR regulator